MASADPTATFLHDNLGIPVHWTQLGTILWFLLLVEVASNFGPAMLRAFVAKPLPAAAPAPVLVAASNPAPVELAVKPVTDAPEPDPPAAAPVPVEPVKIAAVKAELKVMATRSNVHRIGDHRLMSYVATLPVDERVPFGTLYDGYCAHCRRHGVEPMATNQLGAALKRSGVERSRKRGGATYYTRKALAAVA